MSVVQVNEKSVFNIARRIDSREARAEYLRQICGDNPKALGRVVELLEVHEQEQSFLESPAVAHGPLPDVETIDQPSERVGTLIGPYKLLEQIGEGGMGLVYMAEQQRPMRRLVALKLIKPGMDSRQVIARFEAEKQALAMMDHQNIAKVFEAGTTDTGRSYFAMELVRGIPINEFCDQKRLTVRERLELFIQVCQAVQHAHQKGIIHRDLKPNNVLVTLHDTVAVPKVIDFGIVKALGQQLTEHSLHTGFAQLVGTPLYMSPEQAEMNQLGVDTRSDVYSLGVLLYELLTGTTPFDKETLSKAGLDEMRRMIREDEPPRPSARVSTLQAPALSTISQRRSTDPRRISATLRGELDWIVMKALEKDRSRRYESASAFATDIQRYLSDEPVHACTPSTMYKFQKFARKHKPALATAVVIAASLILGTTVSAWQAARATTAEAQANANEQKAVANAATAQENAQQAKAKAQEANQQRDEAQKQRDEVRALNDKLQRTLYASNMNLAQHTWEAGGAERTRELLDQHRPKPGESDLRGFEWHYLYGLCHAEVLTLKDAGLQVAYSPDGKLLLTANAGPPEASKVMKLWDAQSGRKLFTLNALAYSMSADSKLLAWLSADQPGEVKVWDVRTGQELLTFKAPHVTAAGFNGLAFSPDGKRLAVANGWTEGEVKLCDATTGRELLAFKGIGHYVTFSPDGKRLASGRGQLGQNGQVKMWDSETGEELLSFKGGGALGVVFSPDAKSLASRDRKQAKVWNAETGRELFTLQGHESDVQNVVFSPDGKSLASAGDEAVKIWDAQTGKELRSLPGHIGRSRQVAFSPDGKRLASRDGRNLKVWDALTGRKLLTFEDIGFGYGGRVAFSPDGKRLASSYGDSSVKVWDIESDQKPRTLSGIEIATMALSPDGKRLAGAAKNNTAKVWDAQTGKELLSLKGHTVEINCVAFSRDGRRLASGSGSWRQRGEVKLWDAETGQELLTLKGPTYGASSVAFSPDGKRLASGSTSQSYRPKGEVMVWDAETGQELLTIEGASNCVAFSPDGRRLASGNGSGPWLPGEVRVWEMPTGKELFTLKGHSAAIWSVAFDPDGKRLASASKDQTVKMWDAQTGEELLTLKGHTGEANDIAFSPDGKRLASASGDRTVKLWDAQTGQELLTVKGHTGGVGGVVFSPSGHWLASASRDGTIKIWDATPLPEKP